MDIDGTLLVDGEVSQPVLEWCMRCRARGLEVYLWSARGPAYARRIAEEHGVTDVFDAVIGKPGYIVDDMGAGWTRYMKIINPASL